jgi:hypothetical protein
VDVTRLSRVLAVAQPLAVAVTVMAVTFSVALRDFVQFAVQNERWRRVSLLLVVIDWNSPQFFGKAFTARRAVFRF